MPVPPQTPIVKFFSPDKRDRGLIEFWSSAPASYQPLDLGAAHPNTRDYPGYKLGKQFNLPNDDKFIVRIWVTDATNPQWFDYAIKYLGDANANPIFLRTYREKRSTYAPHTKGQPLTSVYKLTRTGAGSGYIVGSFPAFTFSGGGGTGAAGHGVVNPDGTIGKFVLDDGGSGYTTAPTFTVEAPPSGGTTATGTATIQPATALLTSEQADEYPEDSEFRGLYLQVSRVYETLPGPWIPFTRYDIDLGPIQGQRRAVLNSGQVTTLGATAKTTYEGRDGSSIVLLEIQENWSDGTGGTGNPAYPIERTNFYDPKRGAVTQTKQIVTDTTSAGSLTVTAGVATLIRYEPFEQNPALRRKIVETWALPGPVRLEDPKYDPERGQITSTAQLVENTGQTGTRTATQDIQYRPSEWGIAVYDKITESWNSDRPDRAGHAWDDARGDVDQTLENVTLTGSEEASLTVSSGVATEINYKPIDAFSADKITDTWALPGPILRDKERYDELRGFIASTRRLVENTNQAQTEDAAGRVRYEASPFGAAVLWQVSESWNTAAFPVRTKDGYDDERGAFQTVSKLKVAAGTEVGSLAVAAGVATLIEFEPVNEFLVDKQTTTWAVPGPLRLLSPKYEADRGQITSTIQLVENTSQSGTRIATKDTQYQPSKWGAALVSEVIEDWADDMPDKPAHAWDDARGNVDQLLEQIPIGAGGQTASLTVTAGVATQIYYKPVDEFEIQQITESWALPGPALRDKERYDERLGKIAATRRLVENTSQVLTESATGRTRYEASGFGAAVLWQITESWDNTAFPTRTDDGHDAERGAYQVASRLVVAAGTETGSLAVATGTATLIEYKAVNAFLLDKSTTTWAVPGPLLRNQERYDAALGLVTGTRQLVANSSQTQSASESGQTRYEPSPFGSALLWEIVEAWDTDAFPLQTSTEFEKDGVKKVVTRQLQPVGDIVTTETLVSSVLTRKFSERYSEFLAFQVIETITVIDDDLLDLPAFVTSIPNLIPEAFRALLATHVESHIVEGIATAAALDTGEFEHSERQLTPLYKEVRSTVLDDIGSLPVTITGLKETNDKKQVVSVTVTLEVDSTTPTVPTETRDVDFKKLGNGLAIETVRTVPDVFPEDSYTTSVLNLIPEKFRGSIPLTESTADSAGSPSTDPTLLTGEFSRTEGRITEFTKRVRVTKLGDITLPVTITGEKETNAKKQVVTVAMKLCLDSTTPTVPTALIDVDFRKLGNGLAVEITKTIPSVFPDGRYETVIEDPVPVEYRWAVPTTTTSASSIGTASTTPTLGTGDLRKIEEQIDAFVKRVTTTSRGSISFPVTLTGHQTTEEYGGGDLIVAATIDDSEPTIDEGLLVVSSEVKEIGTGLYLKVSKTLNDTAWSNLSGQDYNSQYDVLIPFTKRVVAAGAEIGDAHKDISPLDKWRSEVKEIDPTALAAALAAIVVSYPDSANLDLPDVLVSITSVMSKSLGTGDSDGSGSAGAAGPHGSYSLSLSDSAQSSAAISPELLISIKHYWARNIPTTRYFFFLPLPVTSADVITRLTSICGATVHTWPQFRPENHDLVVTGRKVSLQVSAQAAVHFDYYSDGNAYSSTEATSYSKEVGLSTQAVRIPPTIHGSISIGGTTSDSQALTAAAAMTLTGTVGASASVSESDTADGAVTPTSFSATGGASAIPTSGLYLLPSQAQIFGYGYAILHAEVVDFAGVT